MSADPLKPKGKPGRKQTLVAKAWISRPGRGMPFRSHVTLGRGKVHELSTGTHRRELALDFARLHLAHHLSKGDAPFRPEVAPPPVQTEFLTTLPPCP